MICKWEGEGFIYRYFKKVISYTLRLKKNALSIIFAKEIRGSSMSFSNHLSKVL